jgi:hypothetical protein
MLKIGSSKVIMAVEELLVDNIKFSRQSIVDNIDS